MASNDALRGHVDAMLLSVLADGPVHGYGAIERIRDRSEGQLDFPSGTVYPILRRLDAEGCVRSRWEKDGEARKQQRPPRRYYELTAGGRALAGEARTKTLAMAHAGRRLLGAIESEG